MQLLENKKTISSLELVEQINIFRKEEKLKEPSNRLYSEITHDSLLKIIRDEFGEEISLGEMKGSEYTSRGKMYPMFNLTLTEATQVLIKESKVVRKAMISYIEKLENVLKKEYSVKELLIMQLAGIERAELAEQKVENLVIALDSSMDWCSIIKVATHNVVHESIFSWRILKNKSIELGYEIKKLPSTRYEYQNSYHVNCFRMCYPEYNYNFNKYINLI